MSDISNIAYNKLVNSGVFDSEWYLNTYHDVRKIGMEPIEHYLRIGYQIGRSPSATVGRHEISKILNDVNQEKNIEGVDAAGPFEEAGLDTINSTLDLKQLAEFLEIPLLSGDRRIIIIDGTYPTPDRDSGSLDMVNFIKIFNDLGYVVYFIATGNFRNTELGEVEIKAKISLTELGVHVLDDRYAPDVSELIRLKGGYFEKFFLSRVYAGGIFLSNIRTHAPDAQIIFNTVDLHFVRELREGQLERNRFKIIGAHRTAERELYVCRQADVTIVVSDQEEKIIRNRVPGAAVFKVPLLRDVPGTTASYSARSDIGFIGGYKHTPNIDAVTYFLDNIWQLVRKQLPDVQFRLMGADLPDNLKSRTDPGLVIVGYIKELGPMLDTLRLSVAPLRVGAGAKGKVVTSLSHGLPCVATPIAIEGMGIDGCILSATTPQTFAQEIVRAYTQETVWNNLSRRGIETMKNSYSIQYAQEILIRVLECAAARAAA